MKKKDQVLINKWWNKKKRESIKFSCVLWVSFVSCWFFRRNTREWQHLNRGEVRPTVDSMFNIISYIFFLCHISWSILMFRRHGSMLSRLVLFGKNANRIDGSNKRLMCVAYSFLPNCNGLIIHLPRRRAIPAAFNLEEDHNDILFVCCCGPCAHCQEKREMDVRGTYIVLVFLFNCVSFFFFLLGVPNMPGAIIRQTR